jgi:predicted transcriptional regulator
MLLPSMGKQGDAKDARRPAGSLEAEVLAALWTADGPLTAGEVQADLGSELAYTTVMTILSRLYEKGAVERRRAGRAYRYTPVMDQADIAAARMRGMLEAGDDRAEVLARFVGSLSPEDERLLAEVLRETDEEKDR